METRGKLTNHTKHKKIGHKKFLVHFWVWGWLEGKIFSGRGVMAFSGNKPYEGSFCRKEEQWGGNLNHQNSALNQNQGETPSDLHQKLFTPKK
jgi:hypothetical protein